MHTSPPSPLPTIISGPVQSGCKYNLNLSTEFLDKQACALLDYIANMF